MAVRAAAEVLVRSATLVSVLVFVLVLVRWGVDVPTVLLLTTSTGLLAVRLGHAPSRPSAPGLPGLA